MRWKKNLLRVSVALGVIYLMLSIPAGDTVPAGRTDKKSFAWNQDAYWKALEAKYAELRQTGCGNAESDVRGRLGDLEKLLARINGQELTYNAPELGEAEVRMFEVAPLVSACNTGLADYLQLSSALRAAVKKQSEHWDMKDDAVRTTLYRLMYGSRGAVEEIMAQAPAGSFPAMLKGTDEPSATPAADVRNVRLHSGDILVSRGGAPTSALIARGSDYPGNFSHIALVHIDEKTKLIFIIESHIERGVTVSSLEGYLNDKKLRIMVLRLKSDLISDNLMLPHLAAEFSLSEAKQKHIPYDFEMDINESE